MTSDVTVTVEQTLTSIKLAPSSARLKPGATEQFTAAGYDQFGALLAIQPSFTWSLASGSGTISSTGLYTAPKTKSAATIEASSGSISHTAKISVS